MNLEDNDDVVSIENNRSSWRKILSLNLLKLDNYTLNALKRGHFR